MSTRTTSWPPISASGICPAEFTPKIPSVATPQTRATDDDRNTTCQILDAALGDGQLSTEEHRERVSSATKALTLGELQSLVSDLQIRNVRGDAPTVASPPRSRGIWIAVAAVFLLAAAGIAWGLQTGGSPTQNTAGTATSSRTAAPTTPKTTAPPPPDLLSLGGLTGFFAQMGRHFGDTLGYQLDIRSGRADLYRPDAVNGHKTALWIFGGDNWALLNNDATAPLRTTVGDLSKFDVQAVLDTMRNAPQTLGIRNVTDEWLDIQSAQDGSLALTVQVSEGGQGGGHLTVGTDGSVIRIYAPER